MLYQENLIIKNRHDGGLFYLLTQFANDCDIIDLSVCVRVYTGTTKHLELSRIMNTFVPFLYAVCILSICEELKNEFAVNKLSGLSPALTTCDALW